MDWRPAGALDLAPWAAAMIGVNLGTIGSTTASGGRTAIVASAAAA
jgi:hypothetical protein